MKLLLTGDLHLFRKQPRNRTDDFRQTLLNKFKWLFDLATDKMCDAIIQPGDFFDHPRVSFEDLAVLYGIIHNNFARIPIYAVYGQHDLFNHNLEKGHKTPLHFLQTIGLVKIVPNECIPIQAMLDKQESGRVWVSGASWGEEVPEPKEGVFNILVTHRMAIKDDDSKLWEGQEGFVTAQELLDFRFNLVVVGDNHNQFITHDKKRFSTLFNLGSLGRSNIDQTEHIPKVVIYDTDTRKYEEYEVPIQPASEVFDLSKVEEAKERDERIVNFAETLSSGENVALDFLQNLRTFMRQEELDEDVRNELESAMEEM